MSLDFFKAVCTEVLRNKTPTYTIYPEFQIKPSRDLMIRGGKFYAVINKETGFWETDEYKIQEYVDAELRRYCETQLVKDHGESALSHVNVRYMGKFNSKSWLEYKNYISSLPDHYVQLDNKLCFEGQKVKQTDYISKCLPYPLEQGPCDAWQELAGTLYAPEELEKIEWAIGAIVAGESKDIQKFVVLYGDPGAGKGTILKIIQKLFPGYYEMFDAKSLSSNSNAFAFEQFRSNPLIALQTDGDLSRIEDNTKLNSLISHETVVMNEKRKQSYNFTPRCFLFMASNKAVQITDGKSGIIRRLIDVNPTGKTLPKKEYDRLMGQIDFELGGIAWHCLEVYRKLGKNRYNGYKPFDMMERTNAFYNFVLDKYDTFCEEPEGISLENAYDMWTAYCARTGLEMKLPRYRFKEELKVYFNDYVEVKKVDGRSIRGWYCGGLKEEKFESGMKGRKDILHNDPSFGLTLDSTVSLLDDMLKDCQAQYGEDDGHGGTKPRCAWSSCTTTLKNLDTRKLHFVRVPKNHIVIDFDLKNEKGEKDMLKNLEAADKWPRTYAEFSQGGKGIHLHYIYDGDPEELESLYSPDIEVKVYSGKSSLRRRLSRCNSIPVAHLNTGLPKKEAKTDAMMDFESVNDEKHLRAIIGKCLRKDIAQPYTATAVSLIKKVTDDAWESGMRYDIRDMRPAICAFAAGSSHQKDFCMKTAGDLRYFSRHFDEDHKWDGSKAKELVEKEVAKQPEKEDKPKVLVDASVVKELEAMAMGEKEKVIVPMTDGGTVIVEKRSMPAKETRTQPVDETLVFFDIEVFPNLLLVNWKEAGEGKGVVRMINPTRSEIAELLTKKLVGFNCRRYDNHILYARYIGYDLEAIYRLSQRIINGSANAMFGNAYDISYTDVYDFAAKKQSLKKWEIELGIHHQELGLPWDQPVPEERWAEVAAYCDNDVIATEAVFNRLSGDFQARKILAEIAGMTVNDTTNQLTTRIIFGDDPRPQNQFHYPDLAKEFPGYRFVSGRSYYRHDIPLKDNSAEEIQHWQDVYGDRYVSWSPDRRAVTVDEEIGEGGRVYAVPGIHYNVITFDVASMHPSSIIAENGFGKYTEGFKQLLDIRIAIKHKDFESARKMLNGRLAGYLNDQEQADALSQALKIAINSVYGLTAAGFDNKFRDPRNKDNWVAKRGALFIETLRLKVTEMGGKVVHIKTDSIKVEEPTKEISDFIMAYGKEWGYTFEIEDIYEKMCLVNDAVYIALRDKEDPGWQKECRKARKKAEEAKVPYVEPTRWAATGAQFQHPYVFRSLFSGEEIRFQDLCETKTVTSALYLDMNEQLSDVSSYEKDLEKLQKRAKQLLKVEGYSGSWDEWPEWRKQNPDAEDQHDGMIYAELDDLVKDESVLREMIAMGHNYVFIGKAGSFCPVKPGYGGGILVREKDRKFHSATGSKGYRWREGESLMNAGRTDMVDMRYFESLAQSAREAVEEYGSFEDFCSTAPRRKEPERCLPKEEPPKRKEKKAETPPWMVPCGDAKYATCFDCPMFVKEKIPPECRRGYDLTDFIHVTQNGKETEAPAKSAS